MVFFTRNITTLRDRRRFLSSNSTHTWVERGQCVFATTILSNNNTSILNALFMGKAFYRAEYVPAYLVIWLTTSENTLEFTVKFT